MKIRVRFFAILREQAGVEQQELETSAESLASFYDEVRSNFGLSLSKTDLRVAKNGAFVAWEDAIDDGDEIVFIPPVAGG